MTPVPPEEVEHGVTSHEQRDHELLAGEHKGRWVNEVESLTYQLSREREHVQDLEERLRMREHRLSEASGKIASMRARKVWRLAELLGELKRRPSRIVRLPLEIKNLFRRRFEPAMRGDRVDETEAATVSVVKSSDSVVLHSASPWVGAILGAHANVSELDPQMWRSQLDAGQPIGGVVVESAALDMWADLPGLISELSGRGVRSILWRSDSRPVSPGADFDITVTEAPLPDLGSAVVGSIDLALHNPVLKSARERVVAEVDPEHLGINGVSFDPAGFCEEIKRYQVCRWKSDPCSRVATAVAASGTPTIHQGDRDAERLMEAFKRSEVLRARTAQRAMRRALAEASGPGLVDGLISGEAPGHLSQIDVLVVSNRPAQLQTIFRNLGQQTYSDCRLYLAGHGVEFDEARVSQLAADHGVDVADVTRISSDIPLGEVFNRGFAQTSAPVIAKMDDDDYYGPEYLSDLKAALDYSGADVAGKWSHYAYLESSDLLVHRFKEYEFRFSELVAISTLMMHRHVLEVASFPALPFGSGSVFLRDLGGRGGKVFAADRWNYLYNRGAEGSQHTYPLSDLEILNYAEVVCKGAREDAVIV